MSRITRVIARGMLPLTVLGLAAGVVASWAGQDDVARWAWAGPSVVVGIRLAWSIVDRKSVV